MEGILTSSMLWKVVYLKFPEGVICPIINGYAVASTELIPVHRCGIASWGSLLIARYSGFELGTHAIYRCAWLNNFQVTRNDKRLGELMLINTRFLHHVA